VPVRFCRFASVVAIAALFTLAVVWGQAPKKNWKDQGEYDLYSQALKQTDNTKKLELLNAWKTKYATSDYSFERLQIYLAAYVGLGQADKVLETGNQILAVDPKNLQALVYITTFFQRIPPPNVTAEQQSLAEKAAQMLTTNLDGLKPAGTADDAWATGKPELESLGYATLGMISQQRKQYPAAEKAYLSSLKVNAANGQVVYSLGTVILLQRDPDKQAAGLYYVARAAAYTGQGALPAATRADIDKYLTNTYTTFHGSQEGLPELKKTAAAEPFPAAGFKISGKAEIDAQNEAEFAKANPMLALWATMKDALTAANGQQYFDSGVKGALLPGGANGVAKFKGKLISLKPVKQPKELVLGISDSDKGDVLIVLDEALPGTAPVGTELSFEGVPSSFTASPFRVTFDVERLNIGGWTSKIPPPTPKAAAGAPTPGGAAAPAAPKPAAPKTAAPSATKK
jgi:tetratricopeptide (TPR) repeat protein